MCRKYLYTLRFHIYVIENEVGLYAFVCINLLLKRQPGK